MLSQKELKRNLERHLIQKGTSSDFCSDLSSTQTEALEKQIRGRLVETISCPKTDQGRRMNNFCLGSDPEFAFISPGNRRKTRAVDVGLKPGLAAGCDQNLRLAELKGWPTPSVVEHVASLMSALRWMYRVHPMSSQYYWRAGAHCDGDGLGGHVHFGRKRPNRTQEVQALDGLAQVMKTGQFFDVQGWNRRNIGDGDQLQQRYGLFGDIRPQLHGYEYRTLPSWLCSPTKAFVVITASKLAVLDPELISSWSLRYPTSTRDAVGILQMFARYYAGRDDDAWILKHLLGREAFVQQICSWCAPVLDFKLNWGFPEADVVNPYLAKNSTKSHIIPVVIKPHASEVAEMHEHLDTLAPLHYVEVTPTFKNTLPSRDYCWLNDTVVNGLNYAGAGDLLSNLVGLSATPFDIRFHNGMVISADLFTNFSEQEKRRFWQEFPHATMTPIGRRLLQFDRHSMGVDGITKLRNFLLNWKVLPFWTVEEVKAESHKEFLEYRKSVLKAPTKPPQERNL